MSETNPTEVVTDKERLREEFEGWCASNGILLLSKSETLGGYIADSTEIRWEAWQAARAQADADISVLKARCTTSDLILENGDKVIETLRKEFSEAQTQIAMQAVALKDLIEDVEVTKEDRNNFLNFRRYAKHDSDCPHPRGDQACGCGYSSFKFNMDVLLDACEGYDNRAPIDKARQVISATSETIAAWRAKETERFVEAKAKLDVLAEVCSNAGCENLDDLKSMLNAAKETEPLRKENEALRMQVSPEMLDHYEAVQTDNAELRREVAILLAWVKLSADGGYWTGLDEVEEAAKNLLEKMQATALAYEREVKICALEEFGNKVGFGSTTLLKMIAELRAANKGRLK